jgi:hypothetical protein
MNLPRLNPIIKWKFPFNIGDTNNTIINLLTHEIWSVLILLIKISRLVTWNVIIV